MEKSITKHARVEDSKKEKERNAGFVIPWSEGQIMQGMQGAVNRGTMCKKREKPKIEDQIRLVERLQESMYQREQYAHIAVQM